MTEAVEIWIKANEAMKRAGPIDGHDAACTVIARALRARDEYYVSLLTKAVSEITAALVMAGKQHIIKGVTAPFVTAINQFDRESEDPDAATGCADDALDIDPEAIRQALKEKNDG